MVDPIFELTASQLRDALRVASELAGCRSTVEMTQQLKELPRFLGSDTVLVGEVSRALDGDPAAASLSAEEGPVGTFDGETRAAFERLWHEHPVVSRHFTAPSRGALMISDFLSDREWRRTELFGDCYGGRLGIGWEIATQLRFDAQTQACAAFGRTGRDFGDRERAFLDVIGPHLRAVYARTESARAGERRLALLERGIESGGDLVVLVGRDGTITAAGPSARAMLGRWFEGGDGVTLPPELDSWRRAGRGSPDPARIERRRGNARLRLRLVAGTQEDAILVSERRERPADPALLARRLPITHREAEVLALIVGGHINASIALELDLSPHTVGRYVERLYAKLDVHNRAAATAAARDALEEWGEG